MIKKRRGFTLIETVTTLFIVSLLAMLIIPNVGNIRDMANRRQTEAFAHMIEGQMALYSEATGKKKMFYEDLVAGGYLTKEQVDTAMKKKLFMLEGGKVELPG